MHAVEADGGWATKTVTTGETCETFKARDLMQEMAEAAHLCGDPGIQYDTTINRWNPVKGSGRINSLLDLFLGRRRRRLYSQTFADSPANGISSCLPRLSK